MKIAFVTDTHFGYKRFEKDAYLQGRQAILDAAKISDVLILGGDIFDTPHPSIETLADVLGIFSDAIKIYKARNIEGAPIFAIYGNHDRRPKGFLNPIDLLERFGLAKSIHNKTSVYEKEGEKIAISGMGNVPDDMAKACLSSLSAKPVENAFNVLVLHQSFREFDILSKDSLISFDDLPDGFDLYLCGHIHKPILSGKVLNSGSTVVTQLKAEETGQRGWLLYDTVEKKAEFCPISSRPFYYKTLNFESAKPSQIKETVSAEIEQFMKENPNSILKISLCGTLASGFNPSDISLPTFKGNIFVDNNISNPNFTQRLSDIKLTHEKKKSARQYGIEILRKKLSLASFAFDEDPEQLFEFLIKDADSCFSKIKEKIEREATK